MLLVCLNTLTVFALTEVYTGDLTVEEGDTLTVKGKTLEVDGNVILTEGTTLILEDAALVIKERYKSEHSLRTEKAKIIVTNSEIRSAENVMVKTYGELIGTELNLHLRDQSTITVTNSTIYGRIGLESSTAEITDSTVAYVYWNFDSNAEIENTLLGSFVFDCKKAPVGNIFFEQLKKGKKTNLNVGGWAQEGSLTLKNSEVKHTWSLNLENECHKNVTITNSELDLVWIKFPPTDTRIKIAGLPQGDIKEFDLSNAVSGLKLPYTIKLINVTLDKFKPEMLGTEAEIVNSQAMVHSYDHADLIIRNSILFSFYNYGSEKIEFFNVTIKDAMQLIHKPELKSGMKVGNQTIGEGGYFYLVFHNTTVESPNLVIAHKNGTITGDVKFTSLGLDKVYWNSGTITRIFPVIAEPGAEIKVWADDKLIQKVVTNSQGYAEFSLTFDQESYTKEYLVGAGEEKRKVTVVSDTPIDLHQEESLEVVNQNKPETPSVTDEKVIETTLAENIKTSKPKKEGWVLGLILGSIAIVAAYWGYKKFN